MVGGWFKRVKGIVRHQTEYGRTRLPGSHLDFYALFGMDLDRTSPSGTHCSATARKLLPADEMIFSRPVNAPPQTNLANTGTIHPSEA
jgi:hypothetical protein